MAWSVNNDLVNGNDMWLYLVDLSGSTMTSGMVSNAKVLAYSQSASLEVNADTLDVTTKLACRWNAVLPGNASYTVSSDNLYCLKSAADANNAWTIDNLFDAMITGDNIGWVLAQDSSDECGTVGGPDTSKSYYWGEAAVTSLSITAGNNEIVSSSISLTGSGQVNYHSA